MDSTQPKGKRPKLETTNKYNWKLHEMAIIWLNHNFEPKTSSPLSSVYRPGMNNQGEMRIYCDKSCSKRKIDDGFILERPDFFHLSGHAHKYILISMATKVHSKVAFQFYAQDVNKRTFIWNTKYTKLKV